MLIIHPTNLIVNAPCAHSFGVDGKLLCYTRCSILIFETINLEQLEEFDYYNGYQ